MRGPREPIQRQPCLGRKPRRRHAPQFSNKVFLWLRFLSMQCGNEASVRARKDISESTSTTTTTRSASMSNTVKTLDQSKVPMYQMQSTVVWIVSPAESAGKTLLPQADGPPGS
jgi:hypothetical protein